MLTVWDQVLLASRKKKKSIYTADFIHLPNFYYTEIQKYKFFTKTKLTFWCTGKKYFICRHLNCSLTTSRVEVLHLNANIPLTSISLWKMDFLHIHSCAYWLRHSCYSSVSIKNTIFQYRSHKAQIWFFFLCSLVCLCSQICIFQCQSNALQTQSAWTMKIFHSLFTSVSWKQSQSWFRLWELITFLKKNSSEQARDYKKEGNVVKGYEVF